ncbi:1-(5-phosphoribosyl)-5-[(5-phosphoribosylamino)methylideneamino]imidazole-4-carboxamide isomerase [Moraxella bovis]|uniref:1-(5-phosphoribosyl)-5-[(5- phosphoribosylamino)methylideneamino]imidazole-4- carboxamide isomerase n=1 Tax=Moraxella bovis TaxID=476 RepID=UPI0022266133|nr:1-(5-phosphoribosyl)-5-[(5-phosphoribosylamino)methylideneamino]imidazole-4-carboxamide isomerase [Moraxella bovis]UYZ73077.1 1-(5-phosphoribosyl)-5-[(5-phosphoribosylamino)methylideneamino]imidazole-4-carboxamide isomerase [Moraxella bovis]UYZ95270.1 1-(5-phosphoribosyl)-5-[(5-phosphoribosylamino)methylideneamino]imidazole-4-carboxamide isomerase [Moraxella bovis]UZA14302.1 1-(5-phosphoribosyl)-5-[(5-phosphoribosylamino)methylideneamino]imidazole-4-carboxamide isomerase [Moraxella bovis]
MSLIIPALDLIDGQIVRLHQGNYAKQTSYDFDPIKKFQEYINDGANYLHLVDLTGAKDPNKRQIDLIGQIIKQTSADIQVGGGIRNESEIKALFDLGARRVVIGSLAIKEKALVKSWFNTYGADKFVLALDVNVIDNNPYIAISGWQENSGVLLDDIINEYLQVGLVHVLCTDISKDGTLTGSNVALYQDLIKKYPTLKIQSSGGIGNLDDIKAIKNTGVSGIIVGRALLEGKVDLKEAIEC